ncbi:MAG: 50S ribosomal protein L11 methyltransferase [Kiritimatiellae bacterium]|nr:50S ribosomal protein L11 methyltransferase [Kiritimatiellia bacterium]
MPKTKAVAYAILTVETDADKADALAEALEARWNRTAIQIQRPNASRTWIELYFEKDIEALLAAHAVRHWPDVLAAQPRVCRGRDWLSFWKHHFKSRPIGQRLCIRPVWEKNRAPIKRRKTIWLDPGLSFGTGEHFTTRFCLEQLDRLCGARKINSLLDVGTGSGILAIAAAKLGVPRILAFDHDAQALEQALANIRRNRVTPQIRTDVRDLERDAFPKGRFDVVCANVYSRLLIEAAPALANATRHHVVLSGIREAELDSVADAFAAQGGQETVRDGDGEWGGLVFQWIRSSST